MKELTTEFRNKTISELEKEALSLREEIAKTKLNEKVNPQKDTNIQRKKKKRLAVILTVITEKNYEKNIAR